MAHWPAVGAIVIARAGGLALGLALALVACDSKAAPTVVPPTSPAAPQVAARPDVPLPRFCDLQAAEAQATAFHWPKLAASSATPPAPTTWRWVNLWATWCKPCIEEMPQLLAWRDRLAAAGKRIELSFVSMDDSDEEVEAFRKLHPETPPSIRIADAAARVAWLQTFGLDDGAIPIHMFVSASGRLRCTHAGGIREKHYPAIDQLLGE